MYPGATTKRAKARYVAKAKKSAKAKKGHKSATRAKRPNYWKRVKQELHLLICTDDPKYASLRKHLGKESKPTQIAIVTSIAGTIGAYIGVAAAVIGPFVTLGLMALLQVGHNAWCAAQT
ncbi:hypothetical protein EAS62_24115 [Bradyrhizobium zhanjiangense]|uniref:Uncharacterized protein n=2 Tax=Bradyrhizobium zhanjiangense TaxID=1325107 RepID=A0ABY0DFU3_9BRAD|nr:hypothetical protein EAS62_24115 [Bradyrhizobium zhanjiangense]